MWGWYVGLGGCSIEPTQVQEGGFGESSCEMNVVVLYNPIAGAGKAGAAAQRIGEAVRGVGLQAVLAETRIDAADDWLDAQLAEAGALVVVGGDGAVRLAAEPAIRTQTPLYHFPSGTENLFSREFGMDRRVQTLLRALERNEPRLVDVGVVNGRTFLLMVSVGYDAEVVHDLAGRRGSSISHWSYLGPSIRQLRTWRPSRLAVTVDGERIDLGRQGAVVVANSRQYAWRLDPAQRAVMSDGLLDVLFFPIASKAQLVSWVIKCRLRRHLADRRLVYKRGRVIEIGGDRPPRYQLDGDPPSTADNPSRVEPASNHLQISVRPGVLPVLAP